MVVAECLIDGSQDDFSDFLATVKIVLTVGQDFWLDNWNNALRLANGSIASQNIGVLQNSLIAGSVLADLQNATPLGKIAAVFLVLRATLSQVIETYKRREAVSSTNYFRGKTKKPQKSDLATTKKLSMTEGSYQTHLGWYIRLPMPLNQQHQSQP
jgi:hypothetical protein